MRKTCNVKKYKWLLICTFFISTYSVGFSQATEKDYALVIQAHLGGELEVTVPGGRADLVTSKYAFEIEKAKNWKESIGQALWYGLQTNKQPGIILYMETEKDFNYVQQLNSALEYAGLNEGIVVLVYPLDFDQKSN